MIKATEMVNKKEQYVKIFKDVIDRRDESINNRSTARVNAATCGKYILHEQYTADEIEKAEKYKKPLVRYNLLISKVNTLLGNEIGSRRLSKIVPQSWEDEKLAQILNDNFDAISETNSLEEKMISLLADGLIFNTGGWLKRKISVNEYNYLEFKYDLLDTMFVHPDPEFRNSDLSDCNYVVYDQWLSLDEIRMTFGANKYFDDEDKIKSWEITSTLINSIDRKLNSEKSVYKEGNKYLVCQMEKRVTLKAYVAKLEGDRGYVKVTDEEIKLLKKNKVPHEIVSECMDERIHVSAIAPYFDGVVLQDEEFPFPTRRFSVFPCFSFDWNMLKAETPSLIYVLIDIQDRINKGMSQHVDFVTQALGSAWHIPKSERDAVHKLNTMGNEPGVVLEYNNINNKAVRDPAPNVPQDMLNTASFDISVIDSITNINKAMEGFSEKSGETGVLFDSKVRQALAATNSYFENIAKTMRNIKSDYVELSPHVYFESFRILPVKRDGDITALEDEIINVEYNGEIINDIRKFKARVILEDVSNTPNHLEKTFNENMAIVNLIISSGAQFTDIPWELIFKHSTIRDKEKWIEHFTAVRDMKMEQQARAEADGELANIMGMASQMQAAEMAGRTNSGESK